MCRSLWKVSGHLCRPGLMALAVMLGVTLIIPSSVGAQAANGTLLGNVNDESGSAVPGASVTATEVRTNIARTAVSNATGNYIFANLASGVYRVEVRTARGGPAAPPPVHDVFAVGG